MPTILIKFENKYTMKNIMKIIAGNIILFAVYYISAHFTLSLGLPPLGGTPVWVPTGISLAAVLIWGYRLLPAVFLGDFIIGVELVGLNDSTSIIVCLLIGAQAGGHAWLATWLLRKMKLWPNLLITEANIAKFFFISAGVLLPTTLLFGVSQWGLGVLPSEQILSSLFLWWTGGTIGIVIFTPIVLVLFGQPRIDWANRIPTVFLPLILLFIVLITALYIARDKDQQIRFDAFNEVASSSHHLVKDELLKNELILDTMQAYFRNSELITADEFASYLSDLARYSKVVTGIALVDYVTHDNRYDYEQQHGNKIVELDEKGGEKVASIRDDYFAIKYSQVSEYYTSALPTKRRNMNGYDICATPERSALCQRAVQMNSPILVPPLLENKTQFVVINPVRLVNGELKGMVAHLYDYEALFNVIFTSTVRKLVELTVTDITDKNSPTLLFDSEQHIKAVSIDHSKPLKIEQEVKMAGRQWLLSYTPSKQFLTTHTSWTLYWIMSSALLVLSLISLFLLAMTGRIRQVKNEVDVKTKLIQKSEHKYRSLVESIEDEYLLYSHGVDGVFDYISPSVQTLLGFKQNEFLKHYLEYMPDTKVNSQVEQHTQHTLNGHTSKYELEIFDSEGYVHTLSINESPMLNMQGEIIGVEGIAHDITERKETQLELEKLSLAVEHSPSAVIITDKEGRIEYINPKFTAISGYDNDDIFSQYPSIISSGLTSSEVYDELWDTLLSGNEWKGELQNRKKNGDLYWAQELIAPVFDKDKNITHFVATQEDITEVRRLNEQTSYQASHDLLTGLINRREFELRLKRGIESAKRDLSEHALAFLDLDQFKIVNDTCGHVAGDELLRQIGALMQSNIRSRDTLARLGGDEFAIMMEHCGIEQAHQACQQMIELLQRFRFHWEDHTFTLGVSIGLATIDRNTFDCNEALKHVDTACYAAKDAGRNRVEVHTEDSARLQQRKGEVHWSSEINDALDNDRFLLYVQPIVPITKHDANISYEVLVRMKMQDGSVSLPNAFLPAAERYNSSARIDRWVVSETMRWIARHTEHLHHINVFNINLSGQSIGDEAMLGFILKEFENGDLPGEKIKFEITETAAIANLRDASLFMKTLSEHGCRFALDDFGSGLSSFAYLKNLNVDAIKIDGMFVRDMLTDPLDFEMVKSINDIGHVMGLEVVAEYVESQNVMDKLREIGVDHAQGNALGKPVPIDDILK